MNLHKVFQLVTMFAFFLLFPSCIPMNYVAEGPEANANVVVPAWAPPYDGIQFIRYYYIPDIEVYYDVWNQEFAYLQDGSWMFASSLPPMYAGFDLYNSFIVVLNSGVYEPWIHHQYYISHYPRYYYHSVYNVTDAHDIRGFNENKESQIRLKPEERMKLEEASKNRSEHEMVQPPVQKSRKFESTRTPQRVNYYGPVVGRSVKVEKQMRKPQERSQKKK
jgi:hypothetical protein